MIEDPKFKVQHSNQRFLFVDDIDTGEELASSMKSQTETAESVDIDYLQEYVNNHLNKLMKS